MGCVRIRISFPKFDKIANSFGIYKDKNNFDVETNLRYLKQRISRLWN